MRRGTTTGALRARLGANTMPPPDLLSGDQTRARRFQVDEGESELDALGSVRQRDALEPAVDVFHAERSHLQALDRGVRVPHHDEVGVSAHCLS